MNAQEAIEKAEEKQKRLSVVLTEMNIASLSATTDENKTYWYRQITRVREEIQWLKVVLELAKERLDVSTRSD